MICELKTQLLKYIAMLFIENVYICCNLKYLI